MFCNHKWVLLSETVLKSKWEHSMEIMPENMKNIKIPWRMCDAERKHIQVFSCESCGKLKRFVEKI